MKYQIHFDSLAAARRVVLFSRPNGITSVRSFHGEEPKGCTAWTQHSFLGCEKALLRMSLTLQPPSIVASNSSVIVLGNMIIITHTPEISLASG